ncbi:RHS repeat-associated core domain-containing protein [Kitasatospora sp. NBC_01266]|uniref:endonuclease toxin domain-containing protein n=1 Tax=Kitasatospora sp. NBC_01266 TaxID=2903572 RepID=UPI002E322A0E|nr:RHS repeat-associated core domain-containing protein [Kitasatospora sp. NBC_01266]
MLLLPLTTWTASSGTQPSQYQAVQINGGTSGVAYTFTNDAQGNRVTTSSSGATIRTATWDINNHLPQLATETNATGAVTGDYGYDPLGLPQSQRTSGATSYDHHDWLGSITDLTDANGIQQTRMSYDAFGQQTTTAITSNAPTSAFGFAGQYNDPTLTGNQDDRAREYNPSTGRFTGRDPLSASAPYGSAYAYAANAPTLHTDPSGMAPTDPDDPNDVPSLGDLDPENMSPWQAIGSGLKAGFKMPFQFVGDIWDAFTGQNGGAHGFVDKYLPINQARAEYIAAAKLRSFGCNNVADLVQKHADELSTQVVLNLLGGLDSWASRAFGDREPWSSAVAGSGSGAAAAVPDVQDLGAMTNLGETSIWELSSRDKGLAFEEHMGFSNLPAGYKAFDQFEPDTGIALSLKSMDTTLPSFQRAGMFFQRLKSAIDDAKNYDGDERRNPGVLTPDMIKQRVVYVITNSSAPLTDLQTQQMTKAVQYAHDNGVTLLFGSSSG